jgi:hypothetical protein
MNRGYYTMAYLVAYDFDGKNLKERWKHTSDKSGQGLYGEGNHNLSVGDLDGDGKDEIVFGAAALKSDGTLLYRTGFGHGDAMHLSDMDPDNPGLELYDVHEDKQNKYSEEFRDKDGKVIWGTTQTEAGNVDNGRGMAADIDSTNRGFEMWSGTSKGARSVKGKVVTTTGLSQNFRIYFDGDLQDELMDGTGSPTVENGGATGGKIDKYNSSKKTVDRLFSFYNVEGASLNNWTKANPCLVADLFGDWREEFIVRSASDPSKVIIFTTPFTTPYRVYTLMHDTHYRVSIAWQNVAYNQPPHLGYYLPDAVKDLKKPDVTIIGGDTAEVPLTVRPDLKNIRKADNFAFVDGGLRVNKTGLARVRIMDLQGREVLSASRNVKAGDMSMMFGRDVLPEGIFAVTVDVDGVFVGRKVVSFTK